MDALDESVEVEKGRFYFGLPFYIGFCFLSGLLSVTIYNPDILEFLYIISAAPIAAIFFWAYSTYNKGIKRRSALIVLIVCCFASWIIIINSFNVRSEARWLAGSTAYKRELLSQADFPNGQFKHMEWDRWGWAGIGNTVIYLVFDRGIRFPRPVGKSQESSTDYLAKCRKFIVWKDVGIQ